eukprot:m.603706 g.603706  ORF g.603706 m.603706 type:complete len:180 (-) comp58103_c1_seq12:847-1386(-)
MPLSLLPQVDLVREMARLQHPALVELLFFYPTRVPATSDPANHNSNKKHQPLYNLHFAIPAFTASLRSIIDLHMRRHSLLPIASIKTITRQLLQGLQYLHSKQLVHCSLRPEYVVFEPESCTAKIGTFTAWCSSPSATGARRRRVGRCQSTVRLSCSMPALDSRPQSTCGQWAVYWWSS